MKSAGLDAPDHLLYSFIDLGVIHDAWVYDFLEQDKKREIKRRCVIGGRSIRSLARILPLQLFFK